MNEAREVANSFTNDINTKKNKENSFFEMRKQNLLLSGTILHFPIPGSILATAGIEYYTFGGSTGVAGTDYSNGGWR